MPRAGAAKTGDPLPVLIERMDLTGRITGVKTMVPAAAADDETDDEPPDGPEPPI